MTPAEALSERVAALTAEVRVLTDERDRARHEAAEVRRLTEPLTAEVQRLRGLLIEVTWVQPMYNGSPSCSLCGNQKHWGHAEGCDLAALTPLAADTEAA
jgi:hypothetical protein